MVVDVYNNLAAAGFGTASWWCRETVTAHHKSAVLSFWMQATINRWDNQQVSVAAEEKWWQWASLCHPLAAWQLMTLMTTMSWPHTEKAAAAMALASLYSDSGS